MKNKDLKKHGLLFAASVGIILLMLIMNHLTPLFADDFSYSVSFVTKNPITSFRDVLESQYLHYFSTNGRTIVHILAQLLLWFGKPGLNIFNALAFLALCYVICFHIRGTLKGMSATPLLLIFAALWFLTPHFGGSYLWVMGAANYLYSPLMILLFFIPYRKALANDNALEQILTPLSLILWFFCSLAAGWSNENTSLALIMMVIATIICFKIQHQRIPCWMFTGLAGNIIGSCLLFFSPAQANRLAAAGGMGDLQEFVRRFIVITANILRYFWFLILIFSIALVLYLMQTKKNGSKLPVIFDKLRSTFVFFIGAGISVYSMIGSPEFPRWAWSSILALFLILTGNMLMLVKPLYGFSSTSSIKRKSGIVSTIVLMLLLLCTGLSYIRIAPELHRVNEHFETREEMIYHSIQNGDFDISVERITTDCTYSSYNLFHELSTNPDIWPNTAVANYYGIESIKVNE